MLIEWVKEEIRLLGSIEMRTWENIYREQQPRFLRSKKVLFLAQVLSLERKCRYVCYRCIFWDITASGI